MFSYCGIWKGRGYCSNERRDSFAWHPPVGPSKGVDSIQVYREKSGHLWLFWSFVVLVIEVLQHSAAHGSRR
jgi:hypothetical protein